MGKAAGGPSGKGRKRLPGSVHCTLWCLDVVSRTLAAHFVTTRRCSGKGLHLAMTGEPRGTRRGDKDKATDSGQQSRRLGDS